MSNMMEKLQDKMHMGGNREDERRPRTEEERRAHNEALYTPGFEGSAPYGGGHAHGQQQMHHGTHGGEGYGQQQMQHGTYGGGQGYGGAGAGGYGTGQEYAGAGGYGGGQGHGGAGGYGGEGYGQQQYPTGGTYGGEGYQQHQSQFPMGGLPVSGAAAGGAQQYQQQQQPHEGPIDKIKNKIKGAKGGDGDGSSSSSSESDGEGGRRKKPGKKMGIF